RIPHDFNRDPFAGSCPFHGDCLEGLASGPAMQQRWRAPSEDLPADHPAWALEAHYLALGLANWACTLSPSCHLIGDGVIQLAVPLGNDFIDGALRLGSRCHVCHVSWSRSSSPFLPETLL